MLFKLILLISVRLHGFPQVHFKRIHIILAYDGFTSIAKGRSTAAGEAASDGASLNRLWPRKSGQVVLLPPPSRPLSAASSVWPKAFQTERRSVLFGGELNVCRQQKVGRSMRMLLNGEKR
ncbi:hypothetical protein niasHT_036966 [Heterodera trifolii]|uniref:Secreted protein n=1 Tax=Heterodera trifolii TaxID=157864 RepID=A0ABD2IPG1_9BILA